MKIITISGKAQHGKDTTAELLKTSLEAEGYKTLIVHYADYLKYICSQYYDWDGKKDEKGRDLLQDVGTDKVRKFDPTFWVETVVRLIKVVLRDDFDYILIPDARFSNEINGLLEHGFNVVSLKVERLNFESALTEVQKQHASETALDGYTFDYVIKAPHGIHLLEEEVNTFLNEHLLQNYT